MNSLPYDSVKSTQSFSENNNLTSSLSNFGFDLVRALVYLAKQILWVQARSPICPILTRGNNRHRHVTAVDAHLSHLRLRIKTARTRTVPGADVGSDHDMVIRTFQARLKNSWKFNDPP